MATAQGTFVRVPCGPGTEMDAYWVEPRGPARASLVVVQEIFGVNASMRDLADDLAGEGYACLVPDIFWRLERRVELGNGEDEALRNRAIALMKRFDVETGVADLAAGAAWLRARKIGSGKVGVLGFCLGGRLAALLGASGAVDAACAFYGVGLDAYLDRLAKAPAPTQFHFGELDTQIPPATIEAVRAAQAQSGQAGAVFVYPGAAHAFYNRHRLDRFDAAAHATSRGRLLDFFGATLR